MSEDARSYSVSAIIAQSLALAALGLSLFIAVISAPWLVAAALDGFYIGIAAIAGLLVALGAQVALMVYAQRGGFGAGRISLLLASLLPLALILFLVTR